MSVGSVRASPFRGPLNCKRFAVGIEGTHRFDTAAAANETSINPLTSAWRGVGQGYNVF
jgi:hypothetical protein